MSTALHPQRPARAVPPSIGSTPRRAAGSWRLALRLAVRDLARHQGRAILMVLLIAVPVAGVCAAATVAEMQVRSQDPVDTALRSLGEADAALTLSRWESPIRQPITGTYAEPVPGPRQVRRDPTEAQVRAAVPADWTLHRIDTVGGTVAFGARGAGVSIAVADTRDAVVAGRYGVAGGRLPAESDEIAVGAPDLANLGAGIGDTVQLRAVVGTEATTRSLLVVGALRSTASQDYGDGSFASTSAVVLPGAVSPESAVTADTVWGAPTVWLVSNSAGPVTWDRVATANEQGVLVSSRAVMLDPPAFCGSGMDLCAPGTTSGIPDRRITTFPVDTGEAAVNTGLIAVAVALAVVQVALLAGPAFAVSLRTRQRDLALLAANGATPADLRRQMFATGLVVGAAGAAVGAVIGYGIAWLAFSIPRLGMIVPPATPPAWWTLLLPAGFAVACAVGAAWIPARLAGRTDVAAALAGRPPTTQTPRRAPALGLTALVAAAGLGLWGAVNSAAGAGALALFAAVLIGQLGLVACIPAIVAGLARLGGRLPVAPRMALRDLSRHRIRTAAAVAAVCASSLVAALLLVGLATFEVPRNPLAEGAFDTPRATTLFTQDNPSKIAVLAGRLRAAAPDATVITPRSLVSPGTGRALRVSDPWTELPIAVLTDEQSRLLLGSAAGSADVATGRMVTFAGDTGATWGSLEISGRGFAPRRVTAPAVAPFVPAAVVVGTAFDPGTIGAEIGSPRAVYVITEGLPADQARAVDRVATASRASTWTSPTPDSGPTDDEQANTRRLLMAGVAIAASITILTALMVTGLALLDARRDLITAGQVGASPRFRRWFAGSAAAIVTALGAVLGIIAMAAIVAVLALPSDATVGIGTPAGTVWAIGDPWRGTNAWVVPVLWLAALVTVPALVAAGAAALATQGRSASAGQGPDLRR